MLSASRTSGWSSITNTVVRLTGVPTRPIRGECRRTRPSCRAGDAPRAPCRRGRRRARRASEGRSRESPGPASSFVTASRRRSAATSMRTSQRPAEVWRRTFERLSATIWKTSAASRSFRTGGPLVTTSTRIPVASENRLQNRRTPASSTAPEAVPSPPRSSLRYPRSVSISPSASSRSRRTRDAASSARPAAKALSAAARPTRSARYGWMVESCRSRAMRRRSSIPASEARRSTRRRFSIIGTTWSMRWHRKSSSPRSNRRARLRTAYSRPAALAWYLNGTERSAPASSSSATRNAAPGSPGARRSPGSGSPSSTCMIHRPLQRRRASARNAPAAGRSVSPRSAGISVRSVAAPAPRDAVRAQRCFVRSSATTSQQASAS